MSKRIRRGDHVKVIAGNDKGKVGEVLDRSEERILVKGVNVRKKHLKRTQESQGPRIVDMEVPVHISNVALCDDKGNALKLSVENKALVYKDLETKEQKVHRYLKKRG